MRAPRPAPAPRAQCMSRAPRDSASPRARPRARACTDTYARGARGIRAAHTDRESDWFALLPRAAAPIYFDLARRASCGFQRCYLRRIEASHDVTGVALGGCVTNERFAVEWLVWHGLSVRVLGVRE